MNKVLSDGGKELDCEAVQKIISDHGITLRIVIPYTPEQNGVSERENRTLVELGRSMLSVNKLSQTFWQQPCEIAVYILNRTAKTPITGRAINSRFISFTNNWHRLLCPLTKAVSKEMG